MRAHRAIRFEREFHFIKSLLQIGDRDGSSNSFTLVAHDIGLISTNDSIQTTATIEIAKRGMRRRNPHGAFDARAVTYGAVTRPGKRRKVTVAVGAARIVAAAKWTTSTTRRRREWTYSVFAVVH